MKKIGCPICKYYQFDGNCTAFPDGIPMMFLSGEKEHTERTKFQENDLVFEWISPEEDLKMVLPNLLCQTVYSSLILAVDKLKL